MKKITTLHNMLIIVFLILYPTSSIAEKNTEINVSIIFQNNGATCAGGSGWLSAAGTINFGKSYFPISNNYEEFIIKARGLLHNKHRMGSAVCNVNINKLEFSSSSSEDWGYKLTDIDPYVHSSNSRLLHIDAKLSLKNVGVSSLYFICMMPKLDKNQGC